MVGYDATVRLLGFARRVRLRDIGPVGDAAEGEAGGGARGLDSIGRETYGVAELPKRVPGATSRKRTPARTRTKQTAARAMPPAMSIA